MTKFASFNRFSSYLERKLAKLKTYLKVAKTSFGRVWTDFRVVTLFDPLYAFYWHATLYISKKAQVKYNIIM